jgi:hypothetical protein
MYFTTSLVAAALAAFTQAQSVTPSGFTPSASSKLDVIFNSTMVMTPGQMLTKAGKSTGHIINNYANTLQKQQVNQNSLYRMRWPT